MKSFLSLAVIGFATWVLTKYTVGEVLEAHSHQNDIRGGLVALAIAALAVLLAYSLRTVKLPERVAGKLAIWLVAGGIFCVALAIGLQFYVASQKGFYDGAVTESLGKFGGLNLGGITGVTVQGKVPPSIEVIGYLGLLAGIALTASGVRIGIASVMGSINGVAVADVEKSNS